MQDGGSEPVELGPEQTIVLGSAGGIRYPVDLATLAAREHRLPRRQWRDDVARYLALHRAAAAQWQPGVVTGSQRFIDLLESF